MNKKIAKALNEQVIFEFNSAYLYLALSLSMLMHVLKVSPLGCVYSTKKKWIMHSNLLTI